MDIVKVFAKNIFGFIKSITLFAIIATIVDVLGVQLLNNYEPQKFLVAIFVGYSLTYLLIAVGTILPQTIAFKNNDAAIWIAKLLQLLLRLQFCIVVELSSLQVVQFCLL